MDISPMQLIQMVKNGKNPEQILISVLQQQEKNNPILQNALSLAQNGDTVALRALAQNLAEQRGLNFDKEFANFKKLF